MIQYLDCYYRNQAMGVMSWNPTHEEGWFEFQPLFWQKGIPFSPIQFPVNHQTGKPPVLHFHRQQGRLLGFPSFFSDFMPGLYAKTLLSHALKKSGKSVDTLSPLAWCSVLGRRGMGVIGFEPSGYPELDEVTPVDVRQLVRHANVLQQGDNKLSESRLRELLRNSLFTTNDGPSAWLSVNDFTGEVLSGQSKVPPGFESWIIHLDGVELAANETPVDRLLQQVIPMQQLALSCGVDVLPCRLMHEGQQTHVLSKRIDRVGGAKIHIQSYLALRESDEPEPRESCEGLFRCMRLLRLPYAEHEECFRRIVLNGLVHNRQDRSCDTFFVCRDDTTWHLSPFSGFSPANTGNMTLAGKKQDWTLDDYLLLGKQQHIRHVKSIVEACQLAVRGST